MVYLICYNICYYFNPPPPPQKKEKFIVYYPRSIIRIFTIAS